MTATNLPVQLTSFIGRERDLAGVEGLLSTSRLVTLTGTGGSGKTRLAIRIAEKTREGYADGAWFVDLAPLHERAILPQLVGQMLGLHAAPDQPLLEALLIFLHSRQLLLVLDNCEHLRDACEELAQQMLLQSPELRILATSREPLAIRGERIYPLSGLAWPTLRGESGQERQHRLDLHELMDYDAVSLFVERARGIAPHFNLALENARAVVEICRRLDGLPLAIELASARLNVLTVQEIAARLDDRFALLTAGQRSAPDARHHTLRAAIDWSYELLSVEERTLLRRLAVFTAGCTLDTAEKVCSGDGLEARRTLDVLSSLVDKSLVVAETTGRAQARYRLLETIRKYALEKLEQAGETARLRDRHLELFLARAEEAEPKLGDAYQQLWLNWLEGEHDNLRAALAWSLESSRIEAGLRTAVAISRFWEIRGYIPEGMTWYERLLAQADERVAPLVHAKALIYAGFMAMFQGNGPAAMEYGRKALKAAETAGDESNWVYIMALGGLDSAARVMGDFQTAFDIGERVIQLLRNSSGPPIYLGMSLLAHGDVAIELGDYATARAVLEEGLGMAREDGDAFRMAHIYNSFGDLARYQGNYSEAISPYEQSITLLRELGAQHDLASVLRNLGRACLLLGNVERAGTLFRESMTVHRGEQSMSGIAECLVGLAGTALWCDLPGAGARLLAAAAAIGGQRWRASVWPAKRMPYDEYLATAQARLSEAAFQAEQAAGREMSLEQAIETAERLPLKAKTTPATGKRPGGLSEREWEVAMLIAQGKSNREIAEELVLSTRTVEKHAANIQAKLGLSSRTQIVRWAMEHGPVQAGA